MGTEIMKTLNEESMVNDGGTTYTINGDIRFKKMVKTPKLDVALKFDNVPINNFLKKLWLNGEEQTFTGSVHVDQDVVVKGNLVDLNDAGNINNVDIKELDENSFRIVANEDSDYYYKKPAPKLGNVVMEKIVLTNE